MANLNRLIALLCLLLPSVSFATIGNGVGEINLAGFIKQADGTYVRAYPNANVDLSSPPKGLTVKSTAMVPTSKGLFDFEITKTANVDTARLGSKVASFAKKVGPLGMALAAAELVCDLTTICNQAGEWFMQQDPAYTGYPETTSLAYYYANAFPAQTNAPSKEIACSKLGIVYGTTVTYNSGTNKCVGTGVNSDVTTVGGSCASGYTASGTTCNLNSVSHLATDSDWSAKQSLLNDDRFTPHLLDAGEDVPGDGLPYLPPGQTKAISQQSIPVRDSSGNVIGRDDSETVIEAVDAATAEAPGKVIIKETTITNRYDNSNTLISTSETTNYTAQTQETQPQSFEIKFDEVEPAELQTYDIPDTFTSTSWGNGSCPDDVTFSVSGHTIAIPSQPVCDTAILINPFVLLIATLIGVYIISGVRSGSAT